MIQPSSHEFVSTKSHSYSSPESKSIPESRLISASLNQSQVISETTLRL